MTAVEGVLLFVIFVAFIFCCKLDDRIKDLEEDNNFLEHDRNFYKNEVKKLQEALKEVK